MPKPLVLAIEPDLRQAAIVKRVVTEKGLAAVAVVDSRDAAVEAMRTSMPDVLLLSALLSPRDEDELMAHLRTLDNAAHLQTHTIPQLASALDPAEGRASRGLLSAFRRRKEPAPTASGCDPDLFAEEIRVFLQRAADKKRELLNSNHSAPDMRPGATESTRPIAPEEGSPESPPSSAWSSPFEWKPSSPSPRKSAAAPRERRPATAVHGNSVVEPPPVESRPAEPAAAPADPAPSHLAAAEPADPGEFEAAAHLPVATALAQEFALANTDAAESALSPATVPADLAFPLPVKEPEPADLAPVVATEFEPAPGNLVPVIAIEATGVVPPEATSPEPMQQDTVAERAVRIVARVHDEQVASREDAGQTEGADEWGRNTGQVDEWTAERLGRLTGWARTESPRSAKPAAVLADDVRALLASLAVPHGIASVRFPRGCRIRRVRVAASRESGGDDMGAVILSRRALDAQREKRPTA